MNVMIKKSVQCVMFELKHEVFESFVSNSFSVLNSPFISKPHTCENT